MATIKVFVLLVWLIIPVRSQDPPMIGPPVTTPERPFLVEADCDKMAEKYRKQPNVNGADCIPASIMATNRR